MSIKEFIFVLLITYGCYSQTNSTINYAPPPSINQSLALNMPINSVNFTLDSKRLAVTDIIADHSANITTINIFAYNGSAQNKLNAASITNLTGSWELFKSSPDSLSCQMIIQNGTNSLAFVKYNDKSLQLNLILTLSEADIRAKLSNATRNQTIDYIKDNVDIGQNCQFIAIEDKTYKINMTGLSMVGTASDWNFSASTSDKKYIISQNKLYRYNSLTNSYEPVYMIPTYSQRYKIINADKRIVITGSNVIRINITQINSTGAPQMRQARQFNQTVFILIDSSTGVSIIGQFPLMGKDNHGQEIAPMTLSAGLTKIGLLISKYNASLLTHNTAIQFVLINIDYNGKKMNPVKPSNPEKLSQIFGAVRGQSDFFLNDNFLVARNQAVCNMFQVNCTEVCWQFVGDKLIQIGSRDVTALDEMNDNFLGVSIDSSSPLTAKIITAVKSNVGITFSQSNFNNYAAITKIIIPTVPNFYQTMISIGASVTIEDDSELRITTTQIIGPDTVIRTFMVKENYDANGQNVVNQSSTIPLSTLVASNARCNLLLASNSINIDLQLLLKPNASYGNTSFINVNNPVLANMTKSNDTYSVSSSCDRVAVNKNIFIKINDTYWAKITNNMTQFDWASLDNTMNYAIVNGDIWKYNAAQRNYSYYYNSSFGPVSGISSNNNRLFGVSMGMSGNMRYFKLCVLADTSAGIMHVFNYSQNVSGQMDISAPETLDYVVIIAEVMSPLNISQNIAVGKLFINDFTNYKSIQGNFPLDALNGSIQLPTIFVQGRYAYFRQTINPSLFMAPPPGYLEATRSQSIYYFDDNQSPKLIFTRKLANEENRKWQKTVIKSYGNKTILLNVFLDNSNGTKRLIIKDQEISILASQIKIDNSKSTGVLVVNNTVITCLIGCRLCTSRYICDACSLGYQLINDGNNCIRCGPSCTSCDSNNAQVCTGCFNGTYLSGTTCLPCQSPCLVCSIISTNCISCPPGKIFNASTSACDSCTVKSCLNCSTATVCSTCRPGFAITSTGTCRPCPSSCAKCNPDNITECQSCEKGFIMSNNKCTKCPSKCLTCNANSICQNCTTGYIPNSNGVCVLECKYPCFTCQDNSPTVCLSCYGTDTLFGSTCTFNTDCNSTRSCQDCGIGYYSGRDGYCYDCYDLVVIPNCLKCNYQQNCDLCEEGYFLNSSYLCATCDDNCLACESQAVCKKCIDGYTLSTDSSHGSCIQCESPCATCLGTATTCTSCISGKRQKGSKCQNQTYTKFKITVQANQSAVLAKVDGIVSRLLVLMGQNATSTDLITIQTVTSGSTVIEGQASSTTTATGDASATLSTNLVGVTDIDGLPLLSSTITTEGGTSTSANNAGMIAGIIIGCVVGIAIIVALLVYFFYIKKQSALLKVSDATNNNINIMQNEPNEPREGTNIEMQTFEKGIV